jgi:hypothetical protein
MSCIDFAARTYTSEYLHSTVEDTAKANNFIIVIIFENHCLEEMLDSQGRLYLGLLSNRLGWAGTGQHVRPPT